MAVVENSVSYPKIEPMSGSKKLIKVVSWELKYYIANQTTWVLYAAAFCFLLGIVSVRNQWGYLLGTTTLGQLAELVYDLMLIFGVMLPFLVTDRVAHDYQQRMHELIMTTPIPTRVYVLGRYLAALLISLSLAIALLAAQILVNFGLALIYSHFPIPDPVTTLMFWGVLTLPVTVLICSLCFCLGTLFPRVTALPKLAECIAWIILALDNDPTDLSWRVYWNPTGAGLMTMAYKQFQDLVQKGLARPLGAAQQAEFILRIQQNMPDVRPWIGPFVALAGIGLLLVFLAVFSFRRFRRFKQTKFLPEGRVL